MHTGGPHSFKCIQRLARLGADLREVEGAEEKGSLSEVCVQRRNDRQEQRGTVQPAGAGAPEEGVLGSPDPRPQA